MTERHGLDTFRTPTLPISSMGHTRPPLALPLRISAKAESIPTLQQPSLFSTTDKIRALWEAEGKNRPDFP